MKHSKRVIDRIKAARDLRGSIESFKYDAAVGFDERFANELRDDEVMPNQAVALELAVRSVLTALEELSDADHLYCHRAM